jgi:hypothetical protein
MDLYSGKVNDYKQFAINHAKDIFEINENCQASSTINDEEED